MTDPIQAAEKLKNEGLWKEVVDLLRPWVLDEKSAAAEVDEKSVSKAIDGTAWA